MKKYLERKERLWYSQIRGDYRDRTIKSTWNPELDFATEKKKTLVDKMVTLFNIFYKD